MENMLQLKEYTVSTESNYPSRDSLRVLSAAVVSRRFRQMLLSDPRKAIEAGYAGESFNMDEGEKAWMSSIRANDLAGFAAQMIEVSYPVHAPVSVM
jgi:hypothetical protein